MPPKPSDKQKALAFYNIDFSLQNQLRIAGQTTTSATSVSEKDISSGGPKDAAQRKKEFIRRRRHQADQDSASKVIQGMSKVAKDAFDKGQSIELNDENDASALGQISWKEKLAKQKPRLDYSDVFDDEIGSCDNLWMWEIENFYPALIDPREHGQFYEADSYLILKTTREPSGSLTHAIYYWIGEKTSLDKAMCAAVHAVNLRNHLGASCRTIREEMNDESDEFLELFSEEIVRRFILTVQECNQDFILYRAYINGPSVEMEAVPLSPESLDPRFVFLLDADKIIWIWSGSRSRVTFSNKVRLFAVKMNKRDKKGKAEIESCNQLKTPDEFWEALTGSKTKPEEPIFEHIPEDHKPERKRLYEVQLGMGYVELPQIELKNDILYKEMLKPKCVFILDCTSELFVWIGKKASRLLKMAGQKMATEFHQIIERPEFCTICREIEGEESTVFRSKFSSWDDIVPFDFTMTADTVQRRGADIKVIMERDKMKTDLVALFLDRLPTMPHEEADQLIEDFNLDLEVIESFVLEGKKFVRLPKEELGIFYTMDCYVFLCRYFDYNEELSENGSKGSVERKFESLFKDKLEVVRMNQQQENHKFLSHFKRKILIRRGRREATLKLNEPELFHMRANGSSICTRTIQVDCRVSSLNSAFCYILRTPCADGDESGVIYVWKGSKCASEVEIKLAYKAAQLLSIKDHESKRFSRLFHGWGKHKIPAGTEGK
uniref:Gelsolin-like domain-containing protein n=1 Tax=Meloidogyne javanica TaxID=6303 RepID=A0A915M8J2_MELJA